MRKLEIQTKFDENDIIYTTKQIKDDKVCHICDGNKTIQYNGKNMKCPECNGFGIIFTNKFKHIVLEEPYKISKIKVDIHNDGLYTIKYKGRCGFEIYNRMEDNLFLTREDAQKRCKELDREKKFLKIDDILITTLFSESHPSVKKMIDKMNYYNENKKFNSDIIVNKDNYLVDGYITYLLCKALNIDVVKVIVE